VVPSFFTTEHDLPSWQYLEIINSVIGRDQVRKIDGDRTPQDDRAVHSIVG
jgi:hypothetical protein